jgi:AcrR family transcriptional regulator
MPRSLAPAPRSLEAPTDPRPVPERILAAALQLVESQGLSGLSQARVAQAAGLRQSHLTYYFPTRKDLLLAIVERIHARMTQTLSLPEANGGPLSLAELRAFLAGTVNEPLMGRLMAALMAAADEDPSLRRWLLDFDQEVLGLMRADFGRFGVDPPEDDLMLFSSTMLGAVLMAAQADTPAAALRFGRIIGLAFDRVVAASPRAGRQGRRP